MTQEEAQASDQVNRQLVITHAVVSGLCSQPGMTEKRLREKLPEMLRAALEGATNERST